MIICGGSIISLRLRCDDGGFGKSVLGGWCGDVEALLLVWRFFGCGVNVEDGILAGSALVAT